MIEGWTGNDDGSDDADSTNQVDDHDEKDIPTREESQWVSLMKKASGTLMGSSPVKSDGLDEKNHGQLIRRGSHSSFLSARSIESAEGCSAETTPSHSRQGSLMGEPSAVSPGARGSVKRRSSMRKQRRRSSVAAAKQISPVLEKLETDDRDSEFDAPWTKMILLEELGTASSWTVLLLPYIAFIISVLLDTHSAFMVTSVGPLHATSSCVNATVSGSFDVPILPAPPKSCSYPYALETGHGILASGKNSFLLQTFHYKDLMREGVTFASGPITGVSPMSTFFNGDVFFHGLSTDAVTVVAKGMVMVSTVVMQQIRDSAGEWAPVFVARPERLSMACIPNVAKEKQRAPESRWNCTSPRILDVIFSMPGTGILTGGELQVYLLYSSYDSSSATAQEFFQGSPPYRDKNGTESFVFDESGAEAIHSQVKAGYNSDALLSHLVRSSLYTFEHESTTYAKVKISVRLLTLIVTFTFTLFWCWSLGIKGFFLGCCYSGGSCCPCEKRDEDTLPLTGRRRGSMC